MQTKVKVGLLLLLVVALVIGGATQFITTQEVGTPTEDVPHTANSGELTKDALVGQTFTASADQLSGISVMLATYSGRATDHPIVFHLRDSVQATQDVRTVTVLPRSLGDNQYHRFTFAPLPNSQGKQYFWFVTSPEAVPGNAVAVDINTTDPYPAGSAYLVHGQPGGAIDTAVIQKSGKQTVDLVFAPWYTVPLRTAVIHQGQHAAHIFVATWNERRSTYLIWGRALLLAVIMMGLLWMVLQAREDDPDKRELNSIIIRWSLVALLVLAAVYRYIYAIELPVTTDEGNYLYDAWTLRHGTLAGGDGYVKSPLMIIWVMLWQLMFGHTIIAGRLASIAIGTLSVLVAYFTGRELAGKKAGLLAAAAWALSGATIVTNIYVHTQSVALFFGMAGVAMTWLALHGTTPPLTFIPGRKAPSASGWFIVAGMLLGLGVASRKSILAIGLVPLILVLAEGKSWKLRAKHLFMIGLGFAIVLAIFFGVAYLVYGPQGVIEAIGLNSAEDGATAVEASQVEQVREYSLRGMTPFFREALPLIFLSVLGWGFALENLLRRITERLVTFEPSRWTRRLLDHLLPKVGWILPFLVYWWALSFFFNYEGSAFMGGGMWQLWYILGGILVLAAVWPRLQAEAVAFPEKNVVPVSRQPQLATLPNTIRPIAVTATPSVVQRKEGRSIGLYFSQALLLPAWFGGFAFFYMNWIKFHANYIGEFLPPLAIVAGFGLWQLGLRLQNSTLFKDKIVTRYTRRLVGLVAITSIIWAMFLSNFITYMYEHTGTFTQKAAKEAAQWAKDTIPMNEPIFTGAALIPYLSGHHVALDIAHPRWYAYQWIRENPTRLNTFLPSQQAMVQAYRDSHWFLLESQTGFSFLMEYSEIEAGLAKDWQNMKGIENGSNTLTFYKRK